MIYLISDTHFDHHNIIKYSNRPFKDIAEMNDTIITNWNNVVKKDDIIYFVGDFVLGRGKKDKKKKLEDMLNGNIIFIKGNHDNKEILIRYINIIYKGYEFLLIHSAENPFAIQFDGWVIHGHVHNTDLENYPFINIKNKTINVSCEVIGYKPVSIDSIIKFIEERKTIKIYGAGG